MQCMGYFNSCRYYCNGDEDKEEDEEMDYDEEEKEEAAA